MGSEHSLAAEMDRAVKIYAACPFVELMSVFLSP